MVETYGQKFSKKKYGRKIWSIFLFIFSNLFDDIFQAYWLFLKVLEGFNSSGRPVGFISTNPGARQIHGAELWPKKRKNDVRLKIYPGN